MAALITAEAVAIALLGILVAGLLRSHADILRALHDAGIDTEDGTARMPMQPVAANRAFGSPAADVIGVNPDEEAAAIGVVGAQHDTVLAFLTTGCLTCAEFWREFTERGSSALLGESRTVIVTRDPTEESESRVRELAPRHVPVVMSSQAWGDYGVPGAPYFVHVEGASGRILGEGTAARWDQLVSLLGQATADATVRRRHRENDAAREARADRELLSAGYQPGDPRLHPEPGASADS